MKTDSKEYAQALYELTKNKPESEVAVVIKKYVNNLKKQGLLSKVESIIKKFNEIYDRKNGIVKATVFVSRELIDEDMEVIAKVIKKKYQAEEVELEVIVDKNLKGGMKIIVGEEILDNSIAGRLIKLKKVLVS